jgi:hypothetical protein
LPSSPHSQHRPGPTGRLQERGVDDGWEGGGRGQDCVELLYSLAAVSLPRGAWDGDDERFADLDFSLVWRDIARLDPNSALESAQ